MDNIFKLAIFRNVVPNCRFLIVIFDNIFMLPTNCPSFYNVYARLCHLKLCQLDIKCIFKYFRKDKK